MSILYRLKVFLKTQFTPKETVEIILDRYIKQKNRAVFIQVGSNNGVNNDPLRKHILSGNLTGILIEPVSYIFEQLKGNYPADLSLIFENVAVADIDGEKEFFRLKKNDDPNLPIWYDQLGSFRKDVVLKHKAEIPQIEDYLITESITCLSFNTLLKKHNIKQLDLIHIDTEGFDFEIIKMIDFKLIQPTIIVYEHKHLTSEDKKDCEYLLRNQGYSIIMDGNDTVAIKK